MDFDVIVRSDSVDVGIGDGAIAALAPSGSLGGSAQTDLDGTGLVLIPGGIDVHVHCNEPGRTEWEGFATATTALTIGGFTSFFDMPLNSTPATVDVDAFDVKLACAKRSSLIDFGIWGGLVPGNLGQLERLHERGVVGFKAFMCETGIDDFHAVDDPTMRKGMREIAALGSILAVHAEDDSITASLAKKARAEGRIDAAAYLASRPREAELQAIDRVIAVAAETGCRVHIVHVSTAAGVEAVREARGRGVDISWEVTPHHLALTEEDVERIGVLAKCSPVMHDGANRDGLWGLVASDPAAIVSSDHSPAPMSLKSGAEDFFAAWGGISGAQTTRGVLFEGAACARLSLDAAVAATAANPAERFGLRSKGAIEVGRDADLCLVDLNTRWELSRAELRYRHRHSPLVGMRMRGAVHHALLRGNWLVHNRGVCAGTPRARQLIPST